MTLYSRRGPRYAAQVDPLAKKSSNSARSEVEVVNEAWRRVLDDWENVATHDKFINICATLGELQQAAAHYRSLARSDESRAEEAERRINSIASIATQALLAMPRTDPAASSRGVRIAALVVCMAIVIAALVQYLSIR